MDIVEVKIKGTVITARYGALTSGTILRTNAAFAKHLVEDASAADYVMPPVPTGDGAPPSSNAVTVAPGIVDDQAVAPAVAEARGGYEGEPTEAGQAAAAEAADAAGDVPPEAVKAEGKAQKRKGA